MSTDLLNCELLQVDGRQYRVLASAAPPRPQQQAQQDWEADDEPQQSRQQWDGSGGGAGGDEEAEEASVPIREEGGAFVARMHLDQELIPFLIGKGGATKKRIEQDTGAALTFPARNASQGSPLVVRAASRGAVARACTQLDLLVGQALAARGPRGLDYDFFLCLPLANPETSARFEAWRAAVLAEPGAAAAGLEPSLFMHPQHLHLTICMLKLYSEERRELARRTLAALAPRLAPLLGGAPLAVQLRGLQYMNDDPSQMHVMYLGVQDAPGSPGGLQRLQQLCAAVVDGFSQAGLLLPQDERAVKLHATVLNSRYRRRGGSGGGGSSGGGQQGQQQRQPFDGRGLLERHAAVDLGTVALPAVHISQRGAYEPASGFYRCFDSLPLA